MWVQLLVKQLHLYYNPHTCHIRTPLIIYLVKVLLWFVRNLVKCNNITHMALRAMWVSIILYLHELSQHVKMKDIRPAKYIVGLEIHQDRAHRTLHLNQHKYTLDVLKWFNLENCKLVSTTLDPSHFHWHIYWSNHWKCSNKFSLKSSKPKIHWFISVGAVSVRYRKLKTHGWTHWVSVYLL